jgi:hypothetical protein
MDARKKVAKRNMEDSDNGDFLVGYLTTLSIETVRVDWLDD